MATPEKLLTQSEVDAGGPPSREESLLAWANRMCAHLEHARQLARAGELQTSEIAEPSALSAGPEEADLAPPQPELLRH